MCLATQPRRRSTVGIVAPRSPPGIAEAHAMTTSSADSLSVRVDGPAEILQAIPYLLGFHPAESVVLVGMDLSRVVVTARLDLSELDTSGGGLDDLLFAMTNGGVTRAVAAIYSEQFDAGSGRVGRLLEALTLSCSLADCELADVLVVGGGRWWSVSCNGDDCCAAEGHELAILGSRISAEATYAGMSVLPSREALAASLDPLPHRHLLLPALQASRTRIRSIDTVVTRLKQAAEHVAGADNGALEPLSDEQIVSFGRALRDIQVRDAVWTQIDHGKLNCAALWHELASRLPEPFDAAPVFLLGWHAFREGNGALANLAAMRAIASDPGYTAGLLLESAVRCGVNPRRLPPLG